MTLVHSLGYLGIGTAKLSEWKHFATEVLGLELAEQLDDGTLVLRADSYKRRLFIHPAQTDDLQYAGWETASAVDLDALRARLRAQSIPFEEGGADLARQRAVVELIRFKDADGNAVEAFYGATQLRHDPFRSPVGRGPFITGDQGLGHLVLGAPQYAAQVAFYTQVLGFKLSDTCDLPDGPRVEGRAPHLTFLHVNPRHHSLALCNFVAGSRLNHLMFEVTSVDDVGLAYNAAKKAGAPIAIEWGRHANDQMLSFYVRTPSGWMVEIGCDGLQIDDASWTVTHHASPNVWGHTFNRG